MNSISHIIKQAKANPKRIVLPEAGDLRVIEAASLISQQGLAQVILIGNRNDVSQLADSHNIDLSNVEIENPEKKGGQSENAEKYIDALFQARQHKKDQIKKSGHKNLTLDQAREQVADPLIFAALKVISGDADGFVAGAVNTTSDVVKTALQLIGMKPTCKLASSFFLMQHDLAHQAIQGTAIYADCALVIDPDAEQLASIAIASADSAKNLAGLEPKIALLSFSTAGSAKHAHVDKVIEAGTIISQKRPDITLMTEVQFDAAIVANILKQKAPNISVDAPANVFIFPELQSANIGYKIAQRIGGVTAVGPILQGLKHPVNDLSRGCSVQDIVQLVAVTSVQAGSNENRI